MKLYMFPTVPLFADSCLQAVHILLWHIPLLCVQWKLLMVDRGTVRNM